jgi:hypothetical protein
MTKLVTTGFKSHIINQFIESVDEASNNAYYVFAADHAPRSVSTIPTPIDKTNDFNKAYDNMLFGKRLSSSDVKPMIRNVPWVTAVEYPMYDDSEDDLLASDFYVMVDETSFLHVYKCLDNNMNAVSTAQPTFSHVTGSNSTLYQTSDGYRWKYMYSYSRSQSEQFGTASYIPVVANTTVEGQAVEGAIDIIKVEDGGKNYGNYTTGTFVGTDIRIGGSDIIYKISNSALQTSNGYYTGCILYISAGTAVGLYKTLSDFTSNSSGSYATINSAFSTIPTNGDEYQIYPAVNISGDGFQTSNAIARGLVNALATNSIYRVEMLSSGVGYTHATANITANAVVGVTATANVRPIYSPPKGHGFNAETELDSRYLCVGVTFANSESNTVPIDNSFEKIGILKDPLFANVEVVYYSSNGTFSAGETVYKCNPSFAGNAATINITSAVIQANGGNFDTQFTSGDYVYLNSSNLTSHMVSVVNVVTNSSYMTISSNSYFACTDTIIYRANVSTTAIVNSVANSTSLFFNNVAGQMISTDLLIGNTSGAKALVNTTIRNNITKNFDTFVQMYKYTGALSSGSFTENELVFQGANVSDSTANALIHSSNVDGGVLTIYTSNQIGIFTNTTIEGNTSGAIGSVSASFSPELRYGSGEILYLENITAVPRANNTTETLKIIFEL